VITTNNTPLLPGWIDLGSPDPAASAEFYHTAFGWEAEAAATGDEQGDGEGYLVLRKDGKAVGGVGTLTETGARSDWTVYVRAPEAASTIESAEALGARVRVPLMSIGDEGALAQLTDPNGAEFALWQPGSFSGLEAACEDDSLLWIELYTHDPDAAKRFYGELFGWRTDSFAMPEGSYDMWTTEPGENTASFGGMMQITDLLPFQDEKWVPYFMVADTDATVARTVEAGGNVLMPATDGPPGRLAALTDQFGARFNLLKPAPMDG
jgi:predicted enzyme related to lactoylglutathione lyase